MATIRGQYLALSKKNPTYRRHCPQTGDTRIWRLYDWIGPVGPSQKGMPPRRACRPGPLAARPTRMSTTRGMEDVQVLDVVQRCSRITTTTEIPGTKNQFDLWLLETSISQIKLLMSLNIWQLSLSRRHKILRLQSLTLPAIRRAKSPCRHSVFANYFCSF